MKPRTAGESSGRPRPGRGVTIVELMVTLAILAVLLAIALPSMRDFIARKRLEGVAQELNNDLRILKSQQILRRKPEALIRFGTSSDQTCYALYFRGTGRTQDCDCTRSAATACGAEGAAGRPELIRSVSILRSGGVSVTADRTELSLIGNEGMPADNATLRVVVDGSGAGSIQVTTNAVGLASVCSISGNHGAVTPCPR